MPTATMRTRKMLLSSTRRSAWIGYVSRPVQYSQSSAHDCTSCFVCSSAPSLTNRDDEAVRLSCPPTFPPITQYTPEWTAAKLTRPSYPLELRCSKPQLLSLRSLTLHSVSRRSSQLRHDLSPRESSSSARRDSLTLFHMMRNAPGPFRRFIVTPTSLVRSSIPNLKLARRITLTRCCRLLRVYACFEQ